MLNKDLFYHIEYLVTDRCNMNCPYCFEHDRLNIDLSEVNKLPHQDFSFFGGEPLLVLPKLIEWSQKHKLDTSNTYINTNGIAIVENIELIETLGIPLVISLDGPPDVQDIRQKGSYNKIMRGIEAMVARDLPWALQPTIAPQNLHKVDLIYEHVWEILAKYQSTYSIHNSTVGYTFLEDPTMHESAFNTLLGSFHRCVSILVREYQTYAREWMRQFIIKPAYSCSAGVDTVAVLPNGDASFCHRAPYEDVESEDYAFLNSAVQQVGRKNNDWAHHCTLLNQKTTGSPMLFSASYKLFMKKFEAFKKAAIPKEYY